MKTNKLRRGIALGLGLIPCLLIAWPVHIASTLLTLSGWCNLTAWIEGGADTVPILWTAQMGPTYVSSRFPVWALIALGALGTGAGLGLGWTWLWAFSALSILLGILARIIGGGPGHWTYGGNEPETRRDLMGRPLGRVLLGFLEIDRTWAPFQNAQQIENMRGDETYMSSGRTQVIRRR